jgi:hypothetical protein
VLRQAELRDAIAGHRALGFVLDGFDGFLMQQRGSTLRIDRAAVTAERDSASICG